MYLSLLKMTKKKTAKIVGQKYQVFLLLKSLTSFKKKGKILCVKTGFENFYPAFSWATFLTDVFA